MEKSQANVNCRKSQFKSRELDFVVYAITTRIQILKTLNTISTLRIVKEQSRHSEELTHKQSALTACASHLLTLECY